MEWTTDRETRELVSTLAEKQAWLVDCRNEIYRQRLEICGLIDQIDQLLQEISRQAQEIQAWRQITGEAHRETLEEMLRERGDACDRLREMFHRLCESEQSVGKTERMLDELWRELSQQIGGLGDRLSNFTEVLLLPTLAQAMAGQFQVDRLFRRVRVRKGGATLDLDVLACSSPSATVYVVQIENQLCEEAFERMRSALAGFHQFFPEHADKQVHGILAAVNVSDEVGERVLREGFFLARIHGGQFAVHTPGSSLTPPEDPYRSLLARLKERSAKSVA
jgi:hypothetical protein